MPARAVGSFPAGRSPHGLYDAAGIVRQLRNIARIHEHTWNEPGDSTIDLAMSQR